MCDVIIAVIPAPGHEGLLAEGPSVAGCTPERPMLVWQCGCGRWGHFGCAELIQHAMNRPRALVLYAPGGPRLGMVRAMEAAFSRYEFAQISVWASEDARLVDMAGDTLADWEIPDLPINIVPQSDQSAAFALAHLLLQIGKGSEVLVLPVPA